MQLQGNYYSIGSKYSTAKLPAPMKDPIAFSCLAKKRWFCLDCPSKISRTPKLEHMLRTVKQCFERRMAKSRRRQGCARAEARPRPTRKGQPKGSYFNSRWSNMFNQGLGSTLVALLTLEMSPQFQKHPFMPGVWSPVAERAGTGLLHP